MPATFLHSGTIGQLQRMVLADGETLMIFRVTSGAALDGVLAEFQQRYGALPLPAGASPSTERGITMVPVDTMSIARAINIQLQAAFKRGKALDIGTFARSALAMHLHSHAFRSMLEEALAVVIREVLRIKEPGAHRDLLAALRNE